MDGDKNIKVEIAYAIPDRAYVIPVTVPSGTTIKQGIETSGILEQCPEIDLTRNEVGIFSKPMTLDDVIKNGDRIEIYRPLITDPKEARRQRADKK